jgi:hypothetical protein
MYRPNTANHRRRSRPSEFALLAKYFLIGGFMDGEPCRIDTYEGISVLIGKPRRMCFQSVDDAFMREVQSWICQAQARIEDAERKRDDALRDKQRLLSVIKLCEGEIKQQESMLQPMADSLRDAVALLPADDSMMMCTVLEQYEFITGDKG